MNGMLFEKKKNLQQDIDYRVLSTTEAKLIALG